MLVLLGFLFSSPPLPPDQLGPEGSVPPPTSLDSQLLAQNTVHYSKQQHHAMSKTFFMLLNTRYFFSLVLLVNYI